MAGCLKHIGVNLIISRIDINGAEFTDVSLSFDNRANLRVPVFAALSGIAVAFSLYWHGRTFPFLRVICRVVYHARLCPIDVVADLAAG